MKRTCPLRRPVLEISGDVILNLDIVKPPELAKAPDFGGHSEQPLHHVQVMQALVEKHSAAFAFPASRANRRWRNRLRCETNQS